MATTLTASCTRSCRDNGFTGPHLLGVRAAFHGTNQNGRRNLILRLDPGTIPGWLSAHLQGYITDNLAFPEFYGRIVVAEMHLTDPSGKTRTEPLLYEGIVRFDQSPCVVGQECPVDLFMILPVTFGLYPPSLRQCTLLDMRRCPTPPCS